MHFGWHVAASAVVLGAHLPAHAQRYVESDYAGSLNLVLWAIFIVAAVFMWLRKRLRHWWNPEKAAAEDDAADAIHQAEMKAVNDHMDAHMAKLAQEERERWQPAQAPMPTDDTLRPGSFADVQKRVRDKSGK